VIARQAGVDLPERLEQDCDIFGLDADAGVGYGDAQQPVFTFGAQLHFAPLRKLHRVIEQVEQDLFDPPPVARHIADLWVNLRLQGQALHLGHRP